MINNFIKMKKIIVMVILVVMLTGIVTPVFAADNSNDQIINTIFNPTTISNLLKSFFDLIMSLFNFGGFKISGPAKVNVNGSIKLEVKNAPGTVTWKSGDSTVASIDQSGNVKGKKAGTVTIEASSDGKKATHKVEVVNETINNIIDTTSSKYTGKKYTGLTNQQKKQLAYIAYKEQGSVEGAKVELSLMANRTEYKGYKCVHNYVMNSGWFYLPKKGLVPDNPTVSQSYIDAVEEVLVNGNRYVPSNVLEHDCIKDIKSISTGDKSDRNDYIPNVTIIKNKYGSEYVFFGFATDKGDPFGYFK